MEAGYWVLGGEFEDSVFEQRPERRLEPPAPYGAKLCEPQWFNGEMESGDDSEVLTLKKFRGDLAYRRREYEKALREYSSISEQLPSTNFAMKRDVQEGQARCLAHLGRHQEALEIAANLENKATNTDHLTTVLYLHLAVFSSLQSLEKTILCLQKLISLHPLNPWGWWRLAEAYLSPGPDLCTSSWGQTSVPSSNKAIGSSTVHSGTGPLLCFPATLPESAVFSVEESGCNIQKAEKAPKNMQNCLAQRSKAAWMEAQVKACASLIRTRLLLQLTQSQQMSFALERNLRTQQEIAERVKKLNFPADALLLMEEVRIQVYAEQSLLLTCAVPTRQQDQISSPPGGLVSLFIVCLWITRVIQVALYHHSSAVYLFLFLPAFISVNRDYSLVSQLPKPR